MPNVMTAKEMAAYLQMPLNSVYQMARDGTLPAARVGRHWRFHRDVIDEWVRAHSSVRAPAVLVVDDDELVRQTFQDSLELLGCEVALAEDGEVALEITDGKEFDLIFMDLLMPGKDGVETLQELRARGCSSHVALITAYPDSDMISQALNEGFITFLRKPISVGGIQAAAASLLRLRPR